MTFEELKNEVMSEAESRPKWSRLGQFVFNYIDANYGVARHVQFIDHEDCFYNDENIDNFIRLSVDAINNSPKDLNYDKK